MCREVGYVGSPDRAAELLYDPERSLTVVACRQRASSGAAGPVGDVETVRIGVRSVGTAVRLANASNAAMTTRPARFGW